MNRIGLVGFAKSQGGGRLSEVAYVALVGFLGEKIWDALFACAGTDSAGCILESVRQE